MSVKPFPRRLASDDPEDEVILEARSQQVRTLDAAYRVQALNTLMEIREQCGNQWLHDVVRSLAACQGEDVCGKDRR